MALDILGRSVWNESPTRRFWQKVQKGGDCWVWRGALHDCGYGRFIIGGRQVYAHRFSWELHRGLIPGGMCVLHSCDNPPCVNPDHLWLGTRADNTRDMREKGRGFDDLRSMPGSEHPNAKLTEDDIPTIRKLARSGLAQRRIARRFGVSQRVVCKILHHEAWTHVPDADAESP